jgi:hypothetical protein
MFALTWLADTDRASEYALSAAYMWPALFN